MIRAKEFELNAENFDQMIPQYPIFFEYLQKSIKPNKSAHEIVGTRGATDWLL